MDLNQTGSYDVEWICLAQDRDLWLVPVKTMVNLDVLNEARNFWTNWRTISFPSTMNVFVPAPATDLGKK
jgi:hypothetical protein